MFELVASRAALPLCSMCSALITVAGIVVARELLVASLSGIGDAACNGVGVFSVVTWSPYKRKMHASSGDFDRVMHQTS